MNEFDKIFEGAIMDSEPIEFNNNKVVNPKGHFYHITSHSFNDENIYNFETATYRHNLLISICQKNNCIMLFDVIKPTHSHEVIMCKKFEDIEKIIKITNSHLAMLIKKTKEKKYKIKGMRVFRERPTYKIIENRSYLLYLIKYFWENCQQTINNGKVMPYSFFDQIEKGFTKDYKIELLEKLLDMKISEIIKSCQTMNSSEFYSFSLSKYSNSNKQLEQELFFVK